MVWGVRLVGGKTISDASKKVNSKGVIYNPLFTYHQLDGPRENTFPAFFIIAAGIIPVHPGIVIEECHCDFGLYVTAFQNMGIAHSAQVKIRVFDKLVAETGKNPARVPVVGVRAKSDNAQGCFNTATGPQAALVSKSGISGERR